MAQVSAGLRQAHRGAFRGTLIARSNPHRAPPHPPQPASNAPRSAPSTVPSEFRSAGHCSSRNSQMPHELSDEVFGTGLVAQINVLLSDLSFVWMLGA